jgi:cytochrome b subunit of formate dehydrogenase
MTARTFFGAARLMCISRLRTGVMPTILCLVTALVLWQGPAHSATAEPGKLGNDSCLGCHGNPAFQIQSVQGKRRPLQVAADQFGKSVHGKRNCVECHTDVTEIPHATGVHSKDSDARAAWRLNMANACGSCHVASLKSYTGTYHGQVNTLGYANTAKCFDCHGGHEIQTVANPQSSMHPDNRLTTCRKCHVDAGQGFVTFEPHGTSQDLLRYPAIWLASRLMLLMIVSAITFFWVHAALWFYREHRERREGKSRSYVKVNELLESKFKGRHFQRFPLIWRIAHLTVVISLILLTLTGMSLLYADAPWAPVVIHWFGGPRNEALVHRIFAVVLTVVFFAQLIYFVLHTVRKRGIFDLFGPDSLAPRLQDLWDIFAMFKWFFHMGPKPVFDRWTYWEKFDYWAPCTAMAFTGIFGLMLWAPAATSALLPGWVFNVATIFHGEGALLTVLFLFTVHFFNNHFRPDKFPLEVVMFTGSMPIEQFRREHRVEFNRLLASGEIDGYLVDAPAPALNRGARMLGFALICLGLLLLAIVLIGVVMAMTGR